MRQFKNQNLNFFVRIVIIFIKYFKELPPTKCNQFSNKQCKLMLKKNVQDRSLRIIKLYGKNLMNLLVV